MKNIILFVIGIVLISITFLGLSELSSIEPKLTTDNYTETRVNIPKDNFMIEKNYLPEIDEDNFVTIHVAGDAMLAEHVGEYIKDLDMNPFQFFIDRFNNDDLTVINLETAISNPGFGAPAPNKPYTFNAPLESLDKLVTGGVDVVSLANNHTMDYGAEGLLSTIDNLNLNGIKYFGAGSNLNEAFQPLFTDLKNTRIAWIGINDIEVFYQNARPDSPGSANLNHERVIDSINLAKDNSADLIIFYAHWGYERQTRHAPYQEDWAKFLIDNGADMVIGAHPHVRQGHEIYNGKHIYYSLGNFVFTGMELNDEPSTGTLLEMQIDNKEIINVIEHTIQISYHGVPNYYGASYE